MEKYHIALSFAGEDREYVDKVANDLKDRGVDVFYDKFEETNLWGKNLYSYLRDIYQNKALYTVIFVSEAYKNKLWTNHERESAQAKAFEESKEYILPAIFDESVEIPGILKTTGFINLKNLKAAKFADKIIKKLENDGIVLSVDESFNYSQEAKADIDFPICNGDKICNIIKKLRSYDWYKQSPAIENIYELDWSAVNANQIFVLGRNIYQCACGNERSSLSIVKNLRREMAKFPLNVAEHLINGMFYEVYFNSEGIFRGKTLKSGCLPLLISIQTVEKFSRCISFIRKAIHPYRDSLAIMPNKVADVAELIIGIKKKDPPIISSIKFHGIEMIVDIKEDEDSYNRLWTLSFRPFTIDRFKDQISDDWHIPPNQLRLVCDKEMPESTKFKLPDGKTIKQLSIT